MRIPLRKLGLWVLITAFILAFFRWIFGLTMPDAAWEFAIGITILLVGGLVFGRYVSRFWFKSDARHQNSILIYLVLVILLSCGGIGWLLNKMVTQSEFIYFFFAIVLLFLVSASIAAIISLVRNRIRTNIQSARTALAHTQTELQALQSQITPHFLFNTLNNLYGLSISDHKKVPNLILKLSDLLRYSVYEAKDMFVPLQDELVYLINYIEFEKIRLGKRLELTLEIEPAPDKSIKIAPMLLIVFIENAFKHSKNNQDEKIFIEISLKTTGRSIVFFAKNSRVRSESTSALTKKHSGFGLESVRKRLDLLYRNTHQLSIQETDTTYAVHLIIDFQ